MLTEIVPGVTQFNIGALAVEPDSSGKKWSEAELALATRYASEVAAGRMTYTRAAVLAKSRTFKDSYILANRSLNAVRIKLGEEVQRLERKRK
jgi:hypothetical protein